MDDKQTDTPGDPDKRALTGHPDHPPAQPDVPADRDQQSPRETDEPAPGSESGSPGEATSLPGYGG